MKFCGIFLAFVLTVIGPVQCYLQHKRQSDSNNCHTVQMTNICTSGYQEDYAYIVGQCSDFSLERTIRNACRMNSNGDVCAIFDTHTELQELDIACASSLTTSTCTQECGDIITTTRNRYGCCVNIFNTSSSSNMDSFNYSLWSRCGVELVTEECAESSFRMPVVDPNCTQTILTERLFDHVLCRKEFRDSLINVSTGIMDCELDDGSSFCGVNDITDRYCQVGPSIYDQSGTTGNLCQDTSVCSANCIESINNLARNFSCCLNSLLNVTSNSQTPPAWLSSEFWQRCGLTSPGFCTVRFDESSDRISDDSTGPSTAGPVTAGAGSTVFNVLSVIIASAVTLLHVLCTISN